MVRKHIFFSGWVQGVGFRYRALYAARAMGLTGWVQNLWDGRVEMEVQGEPEKIERLVARLKEVYCHRLHDHGRRAVKGRRRGIQGIQLRPALQAISWAATEMAISAGVWALISRPMGVMTRLRTSGKQS